MIRLVHSKKFLQIRASIFPKMAGRNQLMCIAQLLNEAVSFSEQARKGGKLNNDQLDWLNTKLVNTAELLDEVAENVRLMSTRPEVFRGRALREGGDNTPVSNYGTKPEVY